MENPSAKIPDIETSKDCVRVLFREAGGVKRVMQKLGIAKTRAYNFGDPEARDEISFERVWRLSDERATAAARALAKLCGGVFCPVPSGDPEFADPLALTAEAVRSHARAVADIIKAWRDRKLTRQEAVAGIKVVDAAIADLAAVRGVLMAATDKET